MMFLQKNNLAASGGLYRKLLTGYHFLAAPAFIGLSNYLYLGSSFYSGAAIFLSYGLLAGILYLDIVMLLSFLAEKIRELFPWLHQTLKRTLMMFIAANIVSLLAAVVIACLYSLIPLLEVSLSIKKIGGLYGLILVFGTTYCLLRGLASPKATARGSAAEATQPSKQETQKSKEADKAPLPVQ